MTGKQPAAAFPFAGNLLENLELMQKAWGALPQMPGLAAGGMPAMTSMMIPTLDVNELDKRITDLRAVEQWLALNASMLRAAIQALEVQRNTIATLQTLGGAMAAPLATPVPTAQKPASAPPGAGASAHSERAGAPGPGMAQRKPAGSAASRRAARQPAREPGVPNMAESPLNPAAWWGTLQDQFTRIATAAGAGATNPAPKPERPPRKPRTKAGE